MIIKEIKLVVINILDSWGFNEKVAPIFANVIEKYRPNYSVFHSPTGFKIYYKINKNNISKSKELINEIKELSVKNKDNFEDLRIGYAEGTMTCQINILGKIISEPIGATGNEAMKNIRFRLKE